MCGTPFIIPGITRINSKSMAHSLLWSQQQTSWVPVPNKTKTTNQQLRYSFTCRQIVYTRDAYVHVHAAHCAHAVCMVSVGRNHRFAYLCLKPKQNQKSAAAVNTLVKKTKTTACLCGDHKSKPGQRRCATTTAATLYTSCRSHLRW